MVIDKRETPFSGAEPILRAKLTRPRCEDTLVARPHLMDELERGLDRRLTVVAAPPGYGKTTTVALWLCETDCPNAWLSLDPLDNNPRTFVAYLLAAMSSVYPGAGEQTSALLNSPQPAPPAALADALIEDLAVLPGPLILALDDYHLITDPSLEDMMDRLVRYLPSNIHLVFIARNDPALPVSRMRARGELSELRSGDLRFGPDEAQQLLARLTGRAIDQTTASLLDQRTEGWAIGLQLAALALREGETLTSLNQRLSLEGQRRAADYLVEEVLSKQRPEVRKFLLRTSILERLNDSLCAAVIGQESEDTLRKLWHDNLFVAPLDDVQGWYRYHPLFRQLLLQRLKETETPEAVSDLHRRASGWLTGRGLIDEAIGHAIASGDPDAAVRLIDENVHPACDREEWWRIARWLELLPETLRRRPEMLIARAWVLMFNLRIPALARVVAEAEHQLADFPGPDKERLLEDLGLMKTAVAYWSGDGETALRLARESLEQSTPGGVYARSMTHFYFITGQHAVGQSVAGLAHAQRLLDAQIERSDAFISRIVLAQCLIHLETSDLLSMQRGGETLERIAARAGLATSAAWADYILGLIAYELNDLETAERRLRRVIQSRHLANGRCAYESYLTLVLTLEAKGQPAAADRTFREFHDYLVESDNLAGLSLAEALQLRLAGARGSSPALPALTPLDARASKADLNLSFLISPMLDRARCLLQVGTRENAREAEIHLANSRAAAEAMHDRRRQAEILALKALALDAQGRREDALAALDQSLGLVEPTQTIRMILDCGPRILPLLQELAARGVRPAYTARLLLASGAGLPQPAQQAGAGRSEQDALMALRASLTHREMDVLTLLDLRLSNQEIAERLIVEPDTVKKHLHNLYRKLGVGNRREAISYAYHIGLIAAPR